MKTSTFLITITLFVFLVTGCASNPEGPGYFMAGYARAIAWSPDGNIIVAVRDDAIQIKDAKSRKTIKEYSADVSLSLLKPPASVTFTPDGSLFATTGYGGGVRIWDASAMEVVKELENSSMYTALAFTPDGHHLIAAGKNAPLTVWNVQTKAIGSTNIQDISDVISVAISPDGKTLAAGHIDQKVTLWDFHKRKIIKIITGYTGPVLSVAFSPDGDLLATFAGGREVRLFAAKTLTEERPIIDSAKLAEEKKSADAFVALLSLVNTAKSINLVGAPTGMPATESRKSVWPSFNCPIVFSPDGELLAFIHYFRRFSGDYHLDVYDLSDRGRISRHTGVNSAIAFSPDGKRVATSGILNLLMIDPYTGKQLSDF